VLPSELGFGVFKGELEMAQIMVIRYLHLTSNLFVFPNGLFEGVLGNK
jgi:hypothetical protein